MLIRWLLAWIHLLALGIGLGAVWVRGRALRGPLDREGLARVFLADLWWGVAGVTWIVTGVIRAFSGLEKGPAYYLANHLFWGKMVLLAVLLGLEIWPAITLVRWRVKLRRGENVDPARAAALSRVSFVQAVIVVLMVLAASGMARGFGP